MEYKYIIMWSQNGKDNIEAVNSLFAEGWVPVRETPTNPGTGHVISCIVLLQRPKKPDPAKLKAHERYKRELELEKD